MCGECINKLSAGSLADNLLINFNIMKKIFVIICLSTSSSLVFSQTKLEIVGSTTGVKDGTELSILKVQPKFTKPSSQKIKVLVNNGKFYFSTKQDGAEFYAFELLGKKEGFVLSPGKTEMSIPNRLINEAVILPKLYTGCIYLSRMSVYSNSTGSSRMAWLL